MAKRLARALISYVGQKHFFTFFFVGIRSCLTWERLLTMSPEKWRCLSRAALLVAVFVVILEAQRVAASSLHHNNPASYFTAPKRRQFHSLGEGDCGSAPLCSGHGQCTLACECYSDAKKGFWEGTYCSKCKLGYAGSECKVECEGGSCNMCNGHGICNDGVTGDGSCTCFSSEAQGFWAGKDCTSCSSTHFGSSCTQTCPGKLEGANVCYGRGHCNEDVNGDGKCVCAGGYGTLSGCLLCDAAHYGPNCSSVCLGTTVSGIPCSGHGNCSNGFDGNGTCVCQPGSGYGTADCSKRCPASSRGELCFGHGYCQEGAYNSATCICNISWAAPDCATCNRTQTGAACELACPSVGAKICNNRGDCTYGPSGAFCVCVPGYRGTLCDRACPGDPPCSGHGSCEEVTVPSVGTKLVCKCFQSASQGYWDGDRCDRCAVSHNQSEITGCVTACPVGGYGTVCNGQGTCIQGACYCTRTDLLDYCGASCDLSSPRPFWATSTGCGGVYCYIGSEWRDFYYGTYCEITCPGIVSANGKIVAACSAHGYCSEGRQGTGKCTCVHGFSGSNCSLACPTSALGACSGPHRGTCNVSATGQPFCSCYPAYAGHACQITCPSVAGRVCSDHGLCNNTHLGDGTCVCSQGWTGWDCNVACACNPEHGHCNHTVCRDLTTFETCSTCVCDANFCALCDRCVDGKQGEKCEGNCVHGRTVGMRCECAENYSTVSCDVPCPVNPNSNQVCSGLGVCLWGAENSGVCLCNTDAEGHTDLFREVLRCVLHGHFLPRARQVPAAVQQHRRLRMHGVLRGPLGRAVVQHLQRRVLGPDVRRTLPMF